MEKKKTKKKLYKLRLIHSNEAEYYDTRTEGQRAGRAAMRRGHNAVLSEIEVEE